MKYLSLFITVLFIIILTNCEFGSSSKVEITSANIQLSQNSSFDINAPNINAPITKASVKGKVQNKGEKTVKNVVITYKFPRDVVTAKISTLKPGQKANFVTNTYNSRRRTPDYKLESITYDVVE